MINDKNRIQESEAKQYMAKKVRFEEACLNKWSKNEIGYGLEDMFAKNPSKARRVAMLLENQEKMLKRLSEAQISQSFQTRPENVLKVARIGTANSKRGDFAHEVALQTTDDAIFYIKTLYANTIAGKEQTADQMTYEKPYYTSAGEIQRKETVGNAGPTYTIIVDKYPIIPGKNVILLDGEFVAYDNNIGAVTTAGALVSYNTAKFTSGSFVASTGVFTLVFAANVAASSTITIVSQYDSEQSALYDYVPKMNIEVTKKRFSARPMSLGYSYSMMTELVLNITGIGNTEELLLSMVGDEHAKAKDYRAIQRMHSLALTNGTYTFDAAFNTQGELSDKMHAQKILSAINDISGALYNSISRGVINKIIAGSQAVTYFKKHDLWKDDMTDNRVGVFKAGTLSDIEVYQCPSIGATSPLIKPNQAICTYKNPDQPLDIGIVFGVLTELTAALLYPNMYIDGQLAIVEDSLVIDPRFVRLLEISNLPVYTV